MPHAGMRSDYPACYMLDCGATAPHAACSNEGPLSHSFNGTPLPPTVRFHLELWPVPRLLLDWMRGGRTTFWTWLCLNTWKLPLTLYTFTIRTVHMSVNGTFPGARDQFMSWYCTTSTPIGPYARRRVLSWTPTGVRTYKFSNCAVVIG